MKTNGLSWAESEALFVQADQHKPAGHRFLRWKESQTKAFEQWYHRENKRMFLDYPTGEGKSKTALALIAAEGYNECIIIAPPKTHDKWIEDAQTLGIKVLVYSVEKFRMRGTQMPKGTPWIIDEFHKLGAHGSAGFTKLSRMSKDIKVPLIGCSATPNYNDAERIFCAESIFMEGALHNYGDWLFQKCDTEPNRYAYYPTVKGVKGYDTPVDYFQDQAWVAYVEDTADWLKEELILPRPDLTEFEMIGLDRHSPRLMASDMEKRHRRVNKSFIDEHGHLREEIWQEIIDVAWKHSERERWLIVCSHKTVADALYNAFTTHMHDEVWMVTGDTKDISPVRTAFVNSGRGVLIGTTALAEGVDGLDKACQTMLILDDIEGDHAKRRQIIGRILPRGQDDGIERLVITARFSD